LFRPEDERVWDGRLQLLATVTGHGSQPSGYPLGVPEICRLVIVALWCEQRENRLYMEPETHYAKSGAFALPIR
jgi:hypothetical protein